MRYAIVGVIALIGAIIGATDRFASSSTGKDGRNIVITGSSSSSCVGVVGTAIVGIVISTVVVIVVVVVVVVITVGIVVPEQKTVEITSSSKPARLFGLGLRWSGYGVHTIRIQYDTSVWVCTLHGCSMLVWVYYMDVVCPTQHTTSM